MHDCLLNPARQLQGGRLYPGQALFVPRPLETPITDKELSRLTEAQNAELDDLLYDGLTGDYQLTRDHQGDRMPAGDRGGGA